MSTDLPPLAVGALLRFALQDLRDRIFAGVVNAGFDDVRPAHVTLFRWPGPDGQRPSTLATAVQITKQSLNDLLRDLEQRGYLALDPDPSDNRARVIKLTGRGRRLHRAAVAVHARIEEDWQQTLGKARFTELCRALDEITRGLPRRSAAVASVTADNGRLTGERASRMAQRRVARRQR